MEVFTSELVQVGKRRRTWEVASLALMGYGGREIGENLRGLKMILCS